MTGHVQAGHAVNDGVAVAVRCRAALTGRCGGADGEVSSGFGYQGAAGVCRAADDVDVLGAQAGGAEAVFALLCRFPVAGDDASDEAGVAFCVDIKACCACIQAALAADALVVAADFAFAGADAAADWHAVADGRDAQA